MPLVEEWQIRWRSRTRSDTNLVPGRKNKKRNNERTKQHSERRQIITKRLVYTIGAAGTQHMMNEKERVLEVSRKDSRMRR